MLAPKSVKKSTTSAASAKAKAAAGKMGIEKINTEDARSHGKYGRKKGGPELMIAIGVIAVLGLSSVAIYVSKSGQKREADSIKAKRDEVLESNMKKAEEVYNRASNTGKKFVMGKEAADFDTVKLFEPFKSDSNVYNVIYDRNYKDRRGKDKTDQKAMYPEKLRLEKMDFSQERIGVRYNYGFAENKTIPIVIGSMLIPGEKDDAANMGGSITIITVAEEKGDFYFESARVARKPAVAAAPEAAPAPAAPTPAAPAVPAVPAAPAK